MKSSKSTSHSVGILGMVTINEKGQIVIPVEARERVGLKSGDKLLVMMHPSKEGIVFIKPDGLEQYATRMLDQLTEARANSQ